MISPRIDDDEHAVSPSIASTAGSTQTVRAASRLVRLASPLTRSDGTDKRTARQGAATSWGIKSRPALITRDAQVPRDVAPAQRAGDLRTDPTSLRRATVRSAVEFIPEDDVQYASTVAPTRLDTGTLVLESPESNPIPLVRKRSP